MMDAIAAALQKAGFKYVTLDCTGSGRVNECGASVEVLARKGGRAIGELAS